MILRDDDNNTIGPAQQNGLLHERVNEELLENGNIAMTAGGKVIKQADSNRFSFPLSIRCTRTQYQTIRKIASNFEHRKFYTPRRILKDETAIREVEIIFEEIPNVPEGKTYNNNIVEVTMLMVEVLSS